MSRLLLLSAPQTCKWSSCSCRSCEIHSGKPANMFAGACLDMHVFLSFSLICIWSLMSQRAMQSHKNLPNSKPLDIKPSVIESHCLKKKSQHRHKRFLDKHRNQIKGKGMWRSMQKNVFTSVVTESCLPLGRLWSMITNGCQVLLRRAKRTTDGFRLLTVAPAGMCRLWLLSFVACWLFIQLWAMTLWV